MMNKDIQNSELINLLMQYEQCTNQLKELLHAEYSLLKNKEGGFDEVLPKKQFILNELQRLEAKLSSILKGIPIQELINQFADSDRKQLRLHWQKIQLLAKQCKEQNHINGRLISSQLNYLNKTVNLIQYGDTRDLVSYGEQGQSYQNDKTDRQIQLSV